MLKGWHKNGDEENFMQIWPRIATILFTVIYRNIV